jgi:ArsR family transcriptional regulator
VDDLSQIFKALSHETRLAILGLILRHGPMCVCEAEQILGITQAKASRHLRYLRNAGVLEDERDGLIVNYRLPTAPDQDLTAILSLLGKLLAERPLPEARPMLVQIRTAREEGRSAEDAVSTRVGS